MPGARPGRSEESRDARRSRSSTWRSILLHDLRLAHPPATRGTYRVERTAFPSSVQDLDGAGITTAMRRVLQDRAHQECAGAECVERELPRTAVLNHSRGDGVVPLCQCLSVPAPHSSVWLALDGLEHQTDELSNEKPTWGWPA